MKKLSNSETNLKSQFATTVDPFAVEVPVQNKFSDVWLKRFFLERKIFVQQAGKRDSLIASSAIIYF